MVAETLTIAVDFDDRNIDKILGWDKIYQRLLK
jgi:hypothetical protein